MEILLETESEQAAASLAADILDDVAGKLIETWHHCLRAVGDDPECPCIFHYTEKDYNDDNKRIKFYVHESGTHVCLKQIWRHGYPPGRQTKLYLASTLINVLFMRYPTRFNAINIDWK